MKAHLLYVEDDESLSFVTRDNLELKGYEVSYCSNGSAALQLVQRQRFDLCILDVMLPDVDGFTIAQQIRQQDVQVPILFLTAKSLKEDRIHGLSIGGDDYILKPFSIEELLLKIDIFLRRRHVTDTGAPQRSKLGRYTFDYKNLCLQHGQEEKRLTQREADLLQYFIQHKNQLLRRSDILQQVWGEDDYFLGRSLDVFISRLRKYLRKDPDLRIENIHGIGFRLQLED